MRVALAAICIVTLLAVAYLSMSLIVLRPPRANYPVWFALAAIFTAQGVLTLTVLGAGAVPVTVRYAALGGGGVLTAIGAWMIRDSLTSAHFEGYALVLGSMVVVQGALTLAAFLRRPTLKTA